MIDFFSYSTLYWLFSPDSQLDLITDTETDPKADKNEENNNTIMPENEDIDLETTL